MPGKYGVIDTAYTPITYDEWMKPLVMMTQQQYANEEALNKLATENASIMQYINPEDDKEAFNRYKSYSDALELASYRLAQNGVSPDLRREIYKLNTQYNLKVKPIESAYTARANMVDAQEKAGPDEIWERDARTVSLDEYLKNPQGVRIRHVSGSDLAKSVMDSLKNLNAEIRSDSNKARLWHSILGDQYFEALTKKGFTSEEIDEILTTPNGGPKVLRDIINNEIAKTGALEWAREGTPERNRIIQYALSGLTGAVGTGTYETLQNRDWKKESASEDTSDLGYYNGFTHNPNPIFTPMQQDVMAQFLNECKKYFTETEEGIVLNDLGKEELKKEIKGRFDFKQDVDAYNEAASSSVFGGGYLNMGSNTPTPLMSFIESMNKSYGDGNGNGFDLDVNYEEYCSIAEKLINGMMKDQSDPFADAKRYWEYTYTPSNDNKEMMKERIIDVLGDADVQGVTFKDENGGKYIKGGKDLKYKAEDIVGIGDINFSPHGIVVSVRVRTKGNESQTKDTRSIRIELPKGLNSNEYANLVNCINLADAYKQQIMAGKYYSGKEMSEEGKAAMKQAYDMAIDAAYLSVSYIFGFNKVKGSEVEPTHAVSYDKIKELGTEIESNDQ